MRMTMMDELFGECYQERPKGGCNARLMLNRKRDTIERTGTISMKDHFRVTSQTLQILIGCTPRSRRRRTELTFCSQTPLLVRKQEHVEQLIQSLIDSGQLKPTIKK
jgi:hypothetical protein